MHFLTNTASMIGTALPGTRSNRLLILIFHRVLAQADELFPTEVTAARFDWQMELIKKHCAPLSLHEACRGLEAGRLPGRAIAVTFDDGYADNATVALPILRKHGIPATFFIATGFLDGGRMWNDTVIECVRHASGTTIDLTLFGLGTEALGTGANRGILANRILRSVKHSHPAERLQKVDAFAASVKADLPSNLMMTSEQVRELASAGMEIGAHTVNHPILRSLEPDEARQEISAGRATLEGIIDKRVSSFAYPNGRPQDDYTLRDRNIVESLGFQQAVSTTRGVAHRRSDMLQLPRFTPWDRSPHRWLARTLLAFGDAR